jgi:hypothetical protein
MDFEVRRNDLRTHRVVDTPTAPLVDGEVLLRIDECALTANNITYGAFGDAMKYWDFFPADDGWGRVPVWGFADVAETAADGVAVGDRVYGYFPMSSHLVVTPGKVTPRSFIDAVAHRATLPPVYNQYQRISQREPVHAERLRSVLRPLFTTSFLIDDWLGTNEMFGATQVVVGSASSKTGLALAASLQARPGVHVVGLTSARNATFVGDVGYYDQVALYGGVAVLDASVPTVFVDMGGAKEVLAEVHGHFDQQLRHSCQVGATHWEAVGFAGALPGPKPEFFFAPSQIQRRVGEWGAAEFESRVDAACTAFAASADAWMTISVHRGPAAVADVFGEVLEGRMAPNEAAIIAFGQSA